MPGGAGAPQNAVREGDLKPLPGESLDAASPRRIEASRIRNLGQRAADLEQPALGSYRDNDTADEALAFADDDAYFADSGAVSTGSSDFAPQASGLMTDLPALALAAVEEGLRNIQDQLAELGATLAGSRTSTIISSCVITLAAAAVACEIARRQIRERSAHLGLGTSGIETARPWSREPAGSS